MNAIFFEFMFYLYINYVYYDTLIAAVCLHANLCGFSQDF